MLFSLVALLFFMVDPLVSTGRSFPNLDEGGEWQYGDVRWVGVGIMGVVGVEGSHFPDCRNKMNVNGNWAGEENPLTLPDGKYHNFPRYYLRYRRASDNRRNQFIASRAPIARGLDDIAVREEPVPIDRVMDPDTFNDIRGHKQFCDIFCHDSRMTKVRMGWRNEIIQSCGIVELLVYNCMTDLRVITEESKDRLIRETFDVVWDSDVLPPLSTGNENFKLMVQNQCASFFRLEEIPRGGRNKDKWVALFNRYLRGARMAGYNLVLFVDNDRAWKDIYIDVMLERHEGKFGAEQYFKEKTYQWPNDGNKEYWYFCEKLI